MVKNMFKLYPNKSSIKKKNSRYLQGGNTTQLDDKLAWWEKRRINLEDIPYTLITIDNVLNKRPDLLAFNVYDSSDLDWIILQFNNIIDVAEEFTYGKIIKVPDRSFVYSNILSKASNGFFTL